MGKYFGTDGIRGRYGVQLTKTLAFQLGQGLKEALNTTRLVIGMDTRESSDDLMQSVISGAQSAGIDVMVAGVVTTPMISLFSYEKQITGVMITASHNPYYDNGIKFFNSEGNKLSKFDEQDIIDIFEDIDRVEGAFSTKEDIGKSKRIDDVVGRYIVLIKNSFPRELSLVGIKIVVDCANGASYLVAPTILEELGADVIVVNDKPDGFNINEGCGALHTKDLCEAVVTYRADLGVALDGDADRVIFRTSNQNGDIVIDQGTFTYE